jgi:DNA-binding NarL/FixJ family response regulator
VVLVWFVWFWVLDRGEYDFPQRPLQPVEHSNALFVMAHVVLSPKAAAKTRVLLVEGHVMVRQALARLINEEDDLQVCGQSSDTPDALKALAEIKPDLIVTDITLKSGNGLELIKILAVQCPEVPVLVLTMHDESLYAEMALRTGATGYIMKTEPMEKLLTAIRRVVSGKIYLSENAMFHMVRQIRGGRKARFSPEELLSDRELQVFQMIGQWKSVREIAKDLHLSGKTVEYYRGKIKEKLQLKNASDLTRIATECSVGREMADVSPNSCAA